jgi:hypothetical protein
MVRLLDPWRKWGWSPFGDEDGRSIAYAESEATLCSDLLCPGCGNPLAPGGRLTIVEEPKQESQELVEEIKKDVTKRELVASMIAEGKPWKEMLKESGLGFKELSAMVKEVQPKPLSEEGKQNQKE